MAARSTPNVIDRLIGYINPGAALRRHAHRGMLQRAYEAASPRDTWRPRRAGASANTDHAADAATLRTKARTLVQNVPYIASALEGLVSYTVGTGIVSRAIGKHAEAFNAVFIPWQKVCDADGRLDWPGIQAAAYRAMEQDGEVIVRLRPRRPSDNLPIPLQLQLLEIDWLDSTKNGTPTGDNRNPKNTIVNGIEYDALGRPAAYWLWDQHPGDLIATRRARNQSTRVPASFIIHLFDPKRPGQGRGVTRFAPVISRTRDTQLYEDAELARKNLETRLGIVASGDISNLGDPAPPGEESKAVTGDLGELASGAIVQLPAGLNLTAIEPKAAVGYVENVKYHMQIIAAGIGVPYELMTGDLNNTNFSSARVGILNFRRKVTSTQWLVLIPKLIERVCAEALDAARLASTVPPSAEAKFDHSPPKWDYVNPEQDVKSDLLEIAGGLTSWSEKLRQRGYNNPQDVLKEIKEDFDGMQGAGVLSVLLALQGKTDPGAPTQPGAGK